MSKERGLKFDQSKPDLTLLPKDALFEIAEVLMMGEKKYGRYNWQKGIEINRLGAAAMRHIMQFNEGETLDPESGKCHLAHAAANMIFAIWMLKNKPEMDDRQGNPSAPNIFVPAGSGILDIDGRYSESLTTSALTHEDINEVLQLYKKSKTKPMKVW